MKKIFRKITKKIKLLSLRMITLAVDVLRISKKYESNPSKKCLIISTTGIGDAIWGTPAIRALKKHSPGLSICILANANSAEIFRRNPFIDKIFIFRKGILKVLSIMKELRNMHFDTVVVFHATDRIIWLTAYLTGASKLIGSRRHSKETHFMITHPVEIPNNMHAIYARHLLIRGLGVRSNFKEIELFIADNEKKRIYDFLKERGVNHNSFLIGFQPGAAKFYKRWPEKNFIKLGKMISKIRDDIRIIITGGKKEKELAQRIADEFNGVSLAGKLTISETSAAIERCNLFITNDTGPMHIAVAMGTPTIALFSATDVESTEPYRAIETFRAISKPKPCKECISKACMNPVCMEQLTPEEVFEVVKKQLFK